MCFAYFPWWSNGTAGQNEQYSQQTKEATDRRKNTLETLQSYFVLSSSKGLKPSK